MYLITELEARFIEEALEDAYEEISQLDDGDTTGVLERIKQAAEILKSLEQKAIEKVLEDE